MLFGSQSSSLVDMLRASAGSAPPDRFLRAFLDEAGRWLPPGYVDDIEGIRAHYEGRVLESLRAALKARYPHTHGSMSPTPFGWVRHVAEQDAAVYDVPTVREVIDGDEPSEDRAHAFADLVRGLDVTMGEAERRVSVAHSVFLRVRPDVFSVLGTDELPPVVVDVFWPSDVRIIPHPLAPTNLAAAFGVALRCAAPSGSEAWEVWRRPLLAADDVDDVDEFTGVRFGQWSASMIVLNQDQHDKGKVIGIERALWDPYPLTHLPVVRWDSSTPEGFPVALPDSTLVAIADALNVALTNEQYLVDQCAHPLLVEVGGSAESQKPIGPGLVYPVRTEGDLRSVTQSTDFAGVRAAVDGLKENLGTTRSQDASAYSADPSSVASGIALKIRNRPQEKKRREAAQRAVAVEEKLLAIMVEVSDYFRKTRIGGPGVTYVMRPGAQDEIEEPEAKQRRFEAAADRGWISDASAATGAGFYRTADEAVAKGLSDELRGKSVLPEDGNISERFTEALAARRAPVIEAEEDEA